MAMSRERVVRLRWSNTLFVELEIILQEMKLAIEAARQLLGRRSLVTRFHIYVYRQGETP